MYPLGLSMVQNNMIKTFRHFKGDVNISFSLPSNVQITSILVEIWLLVIHHQRNQKNPDTIEDLDIEKIGEEIVVTLNLPQNSKKLLVRI